MLPQVQPGGNLSPAQLSRAPHPQHPNPAAHLELAHLLPGFCVAVGNSIQREWGRMRGAVEGHRPPKLLGEAGIWGCPRS